MVVANNEINATKNAGKLTTILMTMHGCGGAMHGALPDEAHPGLHSKGHWMPSSGDFSHCIAAAAAMFNDFGRKHKTLTKNYF